MPALQYVRHALHCDFGSTSTISHSSVFPTAIIASFGSSLKGLNAWCCWRSLWSACRWGWFSICWIKLWTLMLCDRFTIAFGTPEMLKSMFFVINRKVELGRVITMFERTNFLHFVRACFHRFPRSIVIFHDAIVFTFQRFHRSIWRTKFSLQPFTNNLSWTGRVFLLHRFPRSITNWIRFWIGLAWKIQLEVLLQETVERVFQLADVSTVEPDWSFPLVQLWSCFNEIFGGGRGYKYRLSYKVLMPFPCTVHVSRETWYREVNIFRVFVTFISWINRQEEHRLSSAQILTSRYQSIVDNRMKIECASNVVNVREYSSSNQHIVL